MINSKVYQEVYKSIFDKLQSLQKSNIKVIDETKTEQRRPRKRVKYYNPYIFEKHQDWAKS